MIVPDHAAFVLAVDQRLMTVEDFAALSYAMDKAAVEWLKERDFIVACEPPPAKDGVVVEVDFKARARKD